MRLLGCCPSCKNEDTLTKIYEDEFGWIGENVVKCETCKTVWNNDGFIETEEKKGNILIPVSIFRSKGFDGKEYGVSVMQPHRNDIPNYNLIASVLNTALLTRFPRLGVNFSTEGGIEGFYKRTYIELRNSYSEFGLWVDTHYRQGPGVTEILDFYERLVRLTFEEPLKIGRKSYRSGEILRLPRDERGYVENDKIWEILGAVLSYAKSRIFAKKVMGKLVDGTNNPFGAPYIRGLTDEEISHRFVPPSYSQE